MRACRSEIVAALAEAFFPALMADASVVRSVRPEKIGLADLLSTSGGSMTFVAEKVLQGMAMLTPELQRELALLFFLLGSTAGTAAVGGPRFLIPSFSRLKPFAQLPLKEREAILLYWATGPIPLLRKAFKGFKSILLSTLFNAVDEKGRNPLWSGILYDGPDLERPAAPVPERRTAEAVLMGGTLHLADPPCKNASELMNFIAQHGIEAVRITGDGALEISCDVVVVGSGAGGGVTAAVLAEAGAKVIVLEKGGFTPAAELSLREGDSFQQMYEMGSLMTTQDAGMNVLAGSTLGGGTRVNWQASFRTPDHVRQEWAHEHGLRAFASKKYDEALDAVCTRLGVTTGIKEHSKPNQKLKAGLEALGVHCDEIPRNTSTEHACGHCCFGCPSGDKKDMTGTYLADALKAGAHILTGIFAKKIILSKTRGDKLRARTATGVLAETAAQPGCGGGRRWQIIIRAHYVVSSAGALHTPALLLRSGIKVNGNVGKNLRLHPATAVIGIFSKGTEGTRDPEAGPKVYRHTTLPPLPGVDKNSEGLLDLPEEIFTWKGSIFSIFSKEAADWQGSGYGPLLETPSAHPGLMAASIPWLSGVDYKRLCTWLPYVSIVLVLTRDRGSGCVTIGRDGLPRLRYWPNARDRTSMMKGMQLGLRALAAGGSLMLGTLQGGRREVTRFEPERDPKTGNLADQPAFEQYLGRVQKEGIRKNGMMVFSAHQMGTARMGASPKTSAVDERGECWHVRNLYVADASLFPTSSGVNPMITVEATAYMVAKGLAEEFRKQAAKPASDVILQMPDNLKSEE